VKYADLAVYFSEILMLLDFEDGAHYKGDLMTTHSEH